MHLEAVMERVWRHALQAMIVQTWRTKLSEFEDALGGHDRLSFVISFCRPRSCELGGRDRVNLEI